MKTKKEIALTVSTVMTIMALTVTSFAKIFKAPILAASFTRSGIISHITQLGVATLILLALYLYPRTMKVGLLLLSCYFGGAIAIDGFHNEPILIPILILGIIWINAFLRNPEIFISTNQVKVSE
jgi:hypothetical protein